MALNMLAGVEGLYYLSFKGYMLWEFEGRLREAYALLAKEE